MIVCAHCGKEVFWSFPRPEDPCFHCGKPIAVVDDALAEHARTVADNEAWHHEMREDDA